MGSTQVPSLTERHHKGTILVVDDNPDNLRLLTGILTEAGFQARVASSGDHALTTIRKAPPDLVLLDVMMPGMDGFAVCRQLKEDPRTAALPVVFISALNGTIDKVTAFSLGGVDYITKPFQAEEVLARISAHLTLRNLQLELEQKNAELRQALDEIKTLRGILPICMSCKKIRNDDGYWEQLESYICHHTQAEFSHGYCTECLEKLHPDVAQRMKERRAVGMAQPTLSTS